VEATTSRFIRGSGDRRRRAKKKESPVEIQGETDIKKKFFNRLGALHGLIFHSSIDMTVCIR
jgi:hypothetical protein